MSNVTYSFVKESDKDETVFESKVNSFGIDHVTKKDLVSFYLNFSTRAHFDTGLLPVDGSGILSIRTAGTHTQIGYQHAPGMYYINWGSHEGDPNAAKIYVAQPYRIVIADLHNGNILGARTFYSPIPVQHPDTPLYHVNLPNINCRGYRGNGVGWICLYHTEDISSYPFNEKVAKILERCSGVEAYNDQNMSETDGPRFYQLNKKLSHLWDPQEWERYSNIHGVDWTLDPDLWIPVLVEGPDSQDKHYPDGKNLTYADAILGNYKAYYSDPIMPKLVNKISREDLEIDSNDVFNLFKICYNESLNFGLQVPKVDAISSSLKVREELSKVFVAQPQNVKNTENTFSCYNCEIEVNIDEDEYIVDYSGERYCEDCASNVLVWVDHISTYVHSEDDDVHFSDFLEQYIYLPKWNDYDQCSCGKIHFFDSKNDLSAYALPMYRLIEATAKYADPVICEECIPEEMKVSCCKCGNPVPDGNYAVNKITNATNGFEAKPVCNSCYVERTTHAERGNHLTPEHEVICICGTTRPVKDFTNTKMGNHHMNIYMNYGLKSDVTTTLLENPHLASNALNFDPFKKFNLNSFAASSLISEVCPECALVVSEQGSEGYKQSFRQAIEDNICTIMQSGNMSALYGTSLNITSHF